jgi:dTDP-4-amino-4,6-dideoxygalactose transaminase
VTDKKIDLAKPTLTKWSEVEPLFAQVWESGRLTIGPHTKAFEDAAAELMNVAHAIAVSSCTSGLMLVLRALDLTGEVIIPAFTWASTGHAVVWNGMEPRFADIDAATCTMDAADVARRITPRTSAILTANAFGLYPDMDALQRVADEAGVVLLSDSAQAIGATYNGRRGGGLCRAEIFSFSPTKVVTAVEGGLITTDDDALAALLRNMRDYGKSADGTDVETFGLSARISEFHSIVGLANLRHVDELIAARETIVAHYRAGLEHTPGLRFQTISDGCRTSHNYVVIFLDADRYDRDRIYHAMAEAEVQTKRYFFPPLHRQASYRHFPPPDPGLPITEQLANEALALPLYSHLEADDVEQVCERLLRILAEK